jgi:hypothetical protein
MKQDNELKPGQRVENVKTRRDKLANLGYQLGEGHSCWISAPPR